MPSEKRARQRAGREARLAALAQQRKRRATRNRTVILVIVAAVIAAIVYGLAGTGSPPAKKASGHTTTTTHTSTSSSTSTSSTTSTTIPPGGITTSKYCPTPFSATTKLDKPTWSKAPAFTINRTKTYTATIVTDIGAITVKLEPNLAPQTVNSFIFLSDHHFYDCVVFHRVIQTFMDQTGDPTGTGSGGPGYTIPDEYPKKAANPSHQYPIGSVAMANTGQPHSGGSQFFIVTGPEGESLPPSYSIFGQVTSGQSVADTINNDGSSGGTPTKLHRMISVTITES